MEYVTKKVGAKPGKTVAIFGGVHGNETVGVEAVRWAVENVTPECGTLYLVEANPEAILKNVRLVEKNMNRCFMPGNSGATSEERRARELMTLLDECDALLDIHSSNSKDATPFVICEQDGFELARTLDFPIVSSGWDALEPGGADGYMFRNGKTGICLECGSVFDAEAQTTRARNAILQFLQHFGIISVSSIEKKSADQKYVHTYKVGHKETESLSFTKDYADFEPLEEGAVFATDGDTVYVAEKGDCIIFPRPSGAIGSEAFIIGKEIAF